MHLVVPAGSTESIGPLIESLGRSFELVHWAADAVLPEGDDPLLVEQQHVERVASQLAEVPRLLLVVGDATAGEALAQLPAMGDSQVVPRDWPVERQVELIEVRATAWEQRALSLHREEQQGRRGLVESLNRSEDQAVEAMVRNAELARLLAFQSGVLTRLGDAERGFIAEILRHVGEIEKQEDLPGPLRNIQSSLHHTALKIQHIFRSFDYWAQTDRVIDGRTILVVTGDRRTRKLIIRAFANSEAKVQGVTKLEEGLEVLKDTRVDLLYVDWTASQLITEARALQPDIKCVLLTSELLFESFGARMLELPLKNVLITSQTALDEDDEDPLFLRELKATAAKLISEDVFGLEKYLSWGTKIHEILVTHSEQRFEILDQIQQFVPTAGLRRSMSQNLETLADELLMNAIWDAPVDETGHHRYASLSRRKSIQLLPHECPVLRFAADARQVAISVTDPFGGLERDHAYKYMVKCFSRKDDQIDSKRGGAGLGLYTAFLSVSSFIINVAPGFRTEVIGLLDNRLSRRKLSGRSRSYHYFLSEGPLHGLRPRGLTQ